MENQSYLLLLLISFAFLILIFKLYSSSSHQSHNSPPTPLALPVIGHLHLIKNPLHLSLASLSSRYGPIFSLRLDCRSFLVVSSPSAVEECFTKNDIVFANRPYSMAGDCLTYNYASFTWSPYGHLWRILRRLSVVELFSSHTLQKSAIIREQEIAKVVGALHKICKNTGQKVDLNTLISTYSFNIVMRSLTGKGFVGEEEIGSEAAKETIQRIRELFAPSLLLGMCDYFPVLRWIGYKGMERNMMLLHKKRDEFLQRLVDEIRAKNNANGERKRRNFIEALLSVQAEEPEFYSDDIIKSFLLVILSAGADTSSVTLEWAMSRLLTQPEEMQKLREEIDENVGHDRLIKDSDLPKLPYLRCVVNETLRSHPAAPLLLPHFSSEECVVAGYSIPRGTILMVNAWAMHRDPNLWDEPDKFNPERFKAAETEEKGQNFVPFGIGRRACPGAAMALRTVSLALGAFVQCFEWEKPTDHVELDFNANLKVTLHKSNPLQAVCVLRNQTRLRLDASLL
ncbi:hypothetical protein C2S51_003578 [Perilla frutescens var. frutescens]|nr:hypothetical protein C2S51_003578 [Perilla frutescens var. frutescens]